jgi:hypothetical protein
VSSPLQAADEAVPAGGAESSTERIARRLDDLSALEGAPLAAHADLFGALHDELRSALAEIDGA